MTWLISDTLIENLGWTLLHSIWQFALVAGVLFVILKCIDRGATNVRHFFSVCALFVAIALPIATYLQISKAPGFADKASSIAQPDEQFQDGTLTSNTIDHVRGWQAISRSQVAGEEGGTMARLTIFLRQEAPTIFPFAVFLWLLGVAVFSLRMAGGLLHLRKLKSTGIEPVTEDWRQRIERLCMELRIARKLKVVSTNLLSTPIALGIIKPVIVVPASLFLQVEPRQLESLIAHELVHIRRYDLVINMVQSIAETIYFYHPCLWWISKQVRLEREFSADSAVIRALADDRVVYAMALANLEEIRLSANHAPPLLAAAANGGNLMQRIQRILQEKTEIRSARSAWSAVLALLLISVVLLAIFSYSPQSIVNAQKQLSGRKIAIGFVSIPPLDRSANPPQDSDATARLIIAKLTQNKVPAIGFVNGSTISDGEKLYPVRANIVRLWRDAGLEVGIGNFKHVWFYNTPYDDYVALVEKNEAVTKKLLGEKAGQLRYFSYPYLNTGKNAEERDRFEQWLNARGLTSVKYTIDNNEWMYSYAYDMARNDNDLNTMNEVREDFVHYMAKMFDHYEAYSQEMFGRDIAETMVLTPSRLVADSADELFGMIRKRGYTFVSMNDAQSDEAYKTPENMFGEFGNSWFERWTYTKGNKLREEPAVDAEVYKTWKERGPKGN
jgi:beta-lactamase regulating signal transducer with metallopeptidase domain